MKIPANILTAFNLANNLGNIQTDIWKFLNLNKEVGLEWRNVEDIKEWKYVLFEFI